MLHLQCDLQTFRLAWPVRNLQMSGSPGQSLQVAPPHRIFAPTNTPTSANILRKRELGAVITSKRAAPVKTPSIIKVNLKLRIRAVSEPYVVMALKPVKACPTHACLSAV